MGCFNIYCFICGLSYWFELRNMVDDADFNDLTEYRIANKKKPIERKRIFNLDIKSSYIQNWTALTLDNKIVHNCYNDDCGDSFKSDEDKTIYNMYGSLYSNKIEMPNKFNKLNNTLSTYDSDKNLAAFLHTDCWKFLKKKYKIELKFSDLPVLMKDDIPKKFKKYNHTYLPVYFDIIDYGIITKYWGQDFDVVQLLDDKNDWIYGSLLNNNNSKNISRVKKIISQFNFKNDPKRIGPNISATFYNDDIIRIGNNGNFWITKNNKWTEIKKPVVKKVFHIAVQIKDYDKKILNFINNIKQIGEYSKEPIFMNAFSQVSLPKTEEILYSFMLYSFDDYLEKLKYKSIDIKKTVKEYSKK